MADTTESKFITNFETCVTQIGTLGAAYKPPNPIAELAALQSLLTQILAVRTIFQQKEASEETARNSRESLFRNVPSYASDLINYCKSFGVPENVLTNLQSFVREIRGVRAEPKPKALPGANAPKTVSAAQTTYPSIAEHFANLVEAVRTIPNFNPSEDKFKLATLDEFIESLRQANTNVTAADAETSTARQALDVLLYTGANCVINSVKAAKPYIRAVFGADNPVYRTLTGFKFNMPKRLRS